MIYVTFAMLITPMYNEHVHVTFPGPFAIDRRIAITCTLDWSIKTFFLEFTKMQGRFMSHFDR